MKQDEIIEMAREDDLDGHTGWTLGDEEQTRFVAFANLLLQCLLRWHRLGWVQSIPASYPKDCAEDKSVKHSHPPLYAPSTAFASERFLPRCIE